MSVSWTFAGNSSVFTANTPIVPNRSQWNNTSFSDPVPSTIANNVWMNNNGFIVVPTAQNYSGPSGGTLILTLVVDPTELQYQGAATFTVSQTKTNGLSWTLASAPLSANSTTPVSVVQICFCSIGDIIKVAFNFAATYTCPANMKCVNTGFTLQDVTSTTNPIFTIGNLNAAPSFVNVAPRLIVMNNVLNSTNGKITFNLTTNGLVNGPPLFPNGIGIATFNSKPASSLANAISQPIAFEDSRSADNTSITANVLVNAVSGVLIGGTVSGLTVAPAGTIVSLFVLGW